jgi:hypothetical protein
MTTLRRRSANFDAVLVYMDEPQLITLLSGNTRIIATAIISEKPEEYRFFATTVLPKDWRRYLEGSVDLRYLYTFPDRRNVYTFDLAKMKDNKVLMEPYLEHAPEEFLPLPKFFSNNHTEVYDVTERPEQIERLYVDGEWELIEFGQFNQRYADIYAFSVALKNWSSPDVSVDAKRKIRAPFLDRPYRGGFSYVHLFSELNDNVPRTEQLSLDKIKYASPGFVDMFGKLDIFSEVKEIVINFLENRAVVVKSYGELYGFLHKNGYLKMPGSEYKSGEPSEKYIIEKSNELAKLLKIADAKTIFDLTNKNALVSAKVILSLYRRTSELAAFFAQGRISFNK